MCEAYGCNKPGFIVDHIIERTLENLGDEEINHGLKNLQYLCLECHNNKTFSKPKTREDVLFDSNGDLIQRS